MKQFTSGNWEIFGSRLLSKSHMADVKWANRWFESNGSSPCHTSAFVCCLSIKNRCEQELSTFSALSSWVEKRQSNCWRSSRSQLRPRSPSKFGSPHLPWKSENRIRLSTFKEERAVTTLPSALTLFQGADADKIFVNNWCIILHNSVDHSSGDSLLLDCKKLQQSKTKQRWNSLK